MKNALKAVIISAVLLCASGCAADSSGSAGRGVGGGNTVDKVLNEQMENFDGQTSAEQTDISEETSEETSAETESVTESETSAAAEMQSTEISISDAGSADFDLTGMSSDMVYATVYQVMNDPYSYEGKSFRMDGVYYAVYYEPTDQYYHYCLIQDAASCCAQGLEFVWGDGSHVYPDEYPAENSQVVIQGIFETYTEEGDSNLYCHLKDAELLQVTPAE